MFKLFISEYFDTCFYRQHEKKWVLLGHRCGRKILREFKTRACTLAQLLNTLLRPTRYIELHNHVVQLP